MARVTAGQSQLWEYLSSLIIINYHYITSHHTFTGALLSQGLVELLCHCLQDEREEENWPAQTVMLPPLGDHCCWSWQLSCLTVLHLKIIFCTKQGSTVKLQLSGARNTQMLRLSLPWSQTEIREKIILCLSSPSSCSIVLSCQPG